MNFTQNWLDFLRADLKKIGITLPELPDELLPQYYLAILQKIKTAAEQGLELSPAQLRTLDDIDAMLAAEKLARACLAEIAANQAYIAAHEQEIHKLLLQQCPELTEEKYQIYLNWSTWDECEMVFEFVESKVGLRERLKLKLNS